MPNFKSRLNAFLELTIGNRVDILIIKHCSDDNITSDMNYSKYEDFVLMADTKLLLVG